MPYKKGLGLTFIEVLMVIVVLSILVGLALPQFNRAKERTLAREAKANLMRIAEAQKNYALESDGSYYPGSGFVNDTATINSDLGLMLRNDTGRNWDYNVTNTAAYANRYCCCGGCCGKCCCGNYSDCVYTLSSYTSENPNPNPSCP